jgi:hypothetical protein
MLVACGPPRRLGFRSGRNRGHRVTPRRLAVAIVTSSALILLPWIAYLALSLPSSVSARHWPLVWAGLDTAMAAGLALTGWLAIRRDRRVAFVAASTATLLIVDAWFDVCTSPAGRPLTLALLDMGLELAEAGVCVLLAWAVWRDASARGTQ